MTTPGAAVLAALTRAEYRTSSYSTANGNCVMIGFASAEAIAALASADYRTSSHSSGNGACVMVGRAAGWVGIRDSKDPARTTLPIAHPQWTALLSVVRSA